MTIAAMLHAALLALAAPSAPPSSAVTPPAALRIDGVPPVSRALAERTRPYLEYRSAAIEGWNPRTRAMLISTRFGNTSQLHEVAAPLGMRRQISFEDEPIAGAAWARGRGDVLVVQKDVGGGEFWQLYTLKDGRLGLLTDGASRNEINAWSRDGRWLAYSSTRRNGSDDDIRMVDPRDPGTDRMIAQVKGGGWALADFSPDGARAVLTEYVSVTKVNLWLLDVAGGAMRPIGDHARPIAYGRPAFAPDGTLWTTSDEGGDFQRLGRIDIATGRFTAVAPEPRWDVAEFAIADDGRTIAYVLNEDGISRLKLLDTATAAVRAVPGLPAGGIGGLRFAPWGTLGFSVNAAASPYDSFALDPATLRVTRWTASETGGLDPRANVSAEPVAIRSFDGEAMSGFLYRPDPRRFPGRRPLIVDIHGGPEGQDTPGFAGRQNYYLNELGVALFTPNVRGSTGYGKRFVGLDDGPFRREDSVKDIGAFLDRLAADPAIDPARFGVSGGSYGGYMCYASAIRYGARLRGAMCEVAISNFVTFLQNTQSYRRDLRRVEYGDERVPAQRAKLEAISPLARAAELRIPLMVVTGGNDPRVPPSEAEQMVRAVRANGQSAWSLVAADEGHGYAKKANRDYAFWAGLLFWQRNLLGEGASPPVQAPAPNPAR